MPPTHPQKEVFSHANSIDAVHLLFVFSSRRSIRCAHGIPGVTNGQVRIQDFGLNTIHQIPPGVSRPNLFLQLGYEDDGYSDNGYYSHDNGTGDQCKNGVDASVIVSIGHAGAAPLSAISFEGITPDKFCCQAGQNSSLPQPIHGVFSANANV